MTNSGPSNLRSKTVNQTKQDTWRRLRRMGRWKHIKLLMRSDNHSLFALTNKPVTGRNVATDYHVDRSV